MRFEVLECTTYDALGLELWRVLDRRMMTVEWVLFTGGQPGDRFARGWVTEEAERRHPYPADVRAMMLKRLARECRVELVPPPPPPPRTMTPSPPTLEPDAGYLWRRFIYGE